MEKTYDNYDAISKGFEDDLKQIVLELLGTTILTDGSRDFLKNSPLKDIVRAIIIYRQRYPKKKLKVYISRELKNNPLYLNFKPNIDSITEALSEGKEILPYLHKDIKNFLFDDGLLRDWGIIHFHLFPIGERKKDGSDNFILYAFPYEDSIILLDISKHNFRNQELLKILKNNSINLPYSLNGIPPQDITEEEMLILRKLNVGYTIDVEGTCFCGGMKDTEDTRRSMKINIDVENILKTLSHMLEKISKELYLKSKILPDIHIVFDSKNHEIILYDKSSSTKINILNYDGINYLNNCFRNLNLL